MNDTVKVFSPVPGVSVTKMEADIVLREIPQQVREFIPHLKADSYYLFDHERKGPFVAKFVELVPRSNDPQDAVLLSLELITSDGSGQARLAIAMTRDAEGRKISTPTRLYNCRPSWLKSITTPSTATQHNLQQEWENARTQEKEAGLIPSFPSETTMKELEAASLAETVKRLQGDYLPTVTNKIKLFLGAGALTAVGVGGAYLLGLI